MPLPKLETLNIAQPQPASMRMEAMKLGDQLKRTGIYEKQLGLDEERLGLSKQEFGLNREKLDFEKMKQNLELGKQFIPSLRKEEYGKFREWAKKIGAPADLLPDEKTVNAMSPEAFEQLKQQLSSGADNLGKMELETYKAILKQAEEDRKQKNREALEDKKQSGRLALEKVKGEKKEATGKNKELESLKSDYFQQVGRGYSAERGTGQFIPDENKAAVAGKAYESATVIAQRYVDAGGKWEDLGLEDPGKETETPKAEMAEMPSATEHKDKIIKDTQTGKRYKSDGKEWVEIK